MEVTRDEQYIDLYDKLERETPYVKRLSREDGRLTAVVFSTISGEIEWQGQTHRLRDVVEYFRQNDEWEEVRTLSFRRKEGHTTRSPVPSAKAGTALPGVLRVIAFLVGLGGSAAGLVMITEGGVVMLGGQLLVLSWISAILWYVMARVVERLDQMAEALERMASE